MTGTVVGRLLSRLLEEHLGYALDPWPSALERRLRVLAAERGTSSDDLVRYLHANRDPALLGALVAAATVGHTWFHRHEEHFEHMRLGGLAALARPGRPVEVWCAGCSTGEEAWSVAFAADKAGVDVRVLGTDVDPEAVTAARVGIYEAPRGWPDRSTLGRLVIPDHLRAKVRFEVASLVGPRPAAGHGPFDLALCRNVLIYFERAAGVRVIDAIRGRVRRGGALVVAPVEALLRLPPRRRADVPLGWLPLDGNEALATPRRSPPTRPRIETPPPPAATSRAEESPLELAAQRLGVNDPGGAEDLLHGLLNREPNRADAWFLLGEALAARGQARQAAVAFRRAATAEETEGPVDLDTLRAAAIRRATTVLSE